MKKTLLSKLVLSIVLLSISFSVAYSQKCLQGWKYDLPISVSNTVFSSLTDYQVKLVINTAGAIASGKMNVNGDDIRFADTVKCSTIPYWIESGINTSSTVIWIKMPALAASATKIIKMYYGNPNATAASNGDSTFMLFDDFTGSTLDTLKWSNYGSNSTYNISNSKITINAGSPPTNYGTLILVSDQGFASPIIVEGNITATNGYYTHLGTLDSGTWTGYTLFNGGSSAGAHAGMHIGLSYSNGGTFSTNFVTTNTSPGTLTGMWQSVWSSTSSITGLWPGGSFSTTISGLALSSRVQVTFGLDWKSIGSVSFDWVRARQYAISDPTVQIGSEQLNHNSGIEDIMSVNSVRLYPNPAHNMIFVDMTNRSENFKLIHLMDVNGKVLQSVNIQQGQAIYEIPLTNLSKGIYLVQLRGEDGLLTRKVVVN